MMGKLVSLTNTKCLYVISTCLLLGLIYNVFLKPKWDGRIIDPTQIEISEEKSQVTNLKKNGVKKEIGSSIEYYDGWKIINDELKLRDEAETIHSFHYKAQDGDQCEKSTPDFMIIGVAKCGTRELIDFMSVHPNIITKGFPYKLSPEDTKHIIDQVPCKYRDQLSGFKMDNGLESISVPDQILKLNPNMKIIAIVREPVARMISCLTWQPTEYQRNNVITQSGAMKSYIQKMINNSVLNNDPEKIVKASLYDVGLERYLKKFRRNQILVIESNEFKEDPVSVLRSLERFLVIPSFFSDQYFALNRKKNFYCIRKINSAQSTMVCYQGNRGRKQKVEIEPEDKEVLRNYFRPHNENLYRLLGRKFDW